MLRKFFFTFWIVLVSSSFLYATNFWTTPAAVSGTPNAVNASVYFSPTNNTGLALWENHITSEIYAAFFDGTSWGTAQLLGSGTRPKISGVQSFTNNMYAIAVWIDTSNGNALTYAKYIGTGDTTGSWSSAASIGVTTDGATGPLLGVNVSGPAMVLYVNNADELFVISSSDNLTDPSWPTWGSASRLSVSGQMVFNPSFAMQSQVSGSFRAFVSWQEGFNTTGRIAARAYLFGSGWGSIQNLQTAGIPGAVLGASSVAVDPSSSLGLVVWTYSTDNGSSYGAYGIPFTTTWGSSASVGPASVNSYPGAAVNGGTPFALLSNSISGNLEIYTGIYISGPAVTWSLVPQFTSSTINSGQPFAATSSSILTDDGTMGYWSYNFFNVGTAFTENQGSTWDQINLNFSSSLNSAASISLGYFAGESITKGIALVPTGSSPNALYFSAFNFNVSPTPPPPPPPPPSPSPSTASGEIYDVDRLNPIYDSQVTEAQNELIQTGVL